MAACSSGNHSCITSAAWRSYAARQAGLCVQRSKSRPAGRAFAARGMGIRRESSAPTKEETSGRRALRSLIATLRVRSAGSTLAILRMCSLQLRISEGVRIEVVRRADVQRDHGSPQWPSGQPPERRVVNVAPDPRLAQQEQPVVCPLVRTPGQGEGRGQSRRARLGQANVDDPRFQAHLESAWDRHLTDADRQWVFGQGIAEIPDTPTYTSVATTCSGRT